jgi:HEAT repeat protein
LTSAVISSLPEIIEALVESQEGDLLESLVTKITSLVAGEDAKLRRRASKALVDIYQKSGVAAQEVLLLLSRDSAVSCLEVDDSPETYANLVEFCGQIAHRCAEMRDLEILARAAHAIGRPATDKGNEVLAGIFNSSDFHALLSEFDEPTAEAKEQILNVLGGFGPLAAPLLVDVIKEADDDDTRRLAARALGEGGTESTAMLCKELTRYAPPDLSCRILGILPETGVDMTQALNQTILHPDEKVRGMSFELLKGLKKHKSVIDMLLGVTGGDDDEAACVAAGELAQFAFPESVSGLCALLQQSSSPEIQKAACSALGKIGMADAVPALKKVTEAKSFLGLRSAFPDEVRVAAVHALGIIVGSSAKGELEHLLNDKSEEVKAAVQTAIGK